MAGKMFLVGSELYDPELKMQPILAFVD